jgi:hypothetical protein
MFRLPTLSLTGSPRHSEDDKLAWVSYRFDGLPFVPEELALLESGRRLKVRQFSDQETKQEFQFKGVPEKALKPAARLYDPAWPVRHEKRAWLVPLSSVPNVPTHGRLKSPLLPEEGIAVDLKKVGGDKFLVAVFSRGEFPCLTAQTYTVETEGAEPWDAALVTCGELEARDLEDFLRKTFRFPGLPTVNALYSIGLRVHGYTVLPPPLWTDEFEETVGNDGVRMMTKAYEQLSKKARNAAAQPGGISRTELEQRMRMPLAVLDFLADKLVADGELKFEGGFYLPTAAPETYMSPIARKALTQLEALAEAGVDLASERNPLFEKTYRALARMGLGVATETPWVYSVAGWAALRAKLCGPGTLGREWRIAEVKDTLDISRKSILGILNKLEEQGWLERREDHRLVIKEAPAE